MPRSGLSAGCTHPNAHGKPLANPARNGYLKRESGHRRQAGRAGTARLAPPCAATSYRTLFYDPGPPQEPGSTVIWRLTPVAGPGQRRARRKSVSAWLCPPFPLAPCRRFWPEGSRARAMLSKTRGGVQLRCRRGLRIARRKLESGNPPFRLEMRFPAGRAMFPACRIQRAACPPFAERSHGDGSTGSGPAPRSRSWSTTTATPIT